MKVNVYGNKQFYYLFDILYHQNGMASIRHLSSGYKTERRYMLNDSVIQILHLRKDGYCKTNIFLFYLMLVLVFSISHDTLKIFLSKVIVASDTWFRKIN